MREDFSLVPGMNITIGQPISHRIDHMLSGTRANIALKIFGDDLYKLRSLAEKVRQAASGVPGVVDLSVEQQTDIPILKIHFDRAAISRHGLTIGDVSRTVETAFRGETVSQVLEGRNAFDLVVRVGDPKELNADAIANLSVDTPGGVKLPLKALARIQRSTGPNQITRENVQRKIVVMCNVTGRDLRSVVRDIRERVTGSVPLGQGPVSGLLHRVRRPVPECRGDDPAPDPPRPRRGPGHRAPPAHRLRLGAGCPARHGEPAARPGGRRPRASSSRAASSRSPRSSGS